MHHQPHSQCNSSMFFMKKHVLISDPSKSTKPPAGIELWSRHACQICWTEKKTEVQFPSRPKQREAMQRGRQQVKQMSGEGGVYKETWLHTQQVDCGKGEEDVNPAAPGAGVS